MSKRKGKKKPTRKDITVFLKHIKEHESMHKTTYGNCMVCGKPKKGPRCLKCETEG